MIEQIVPTQILGQATLYKERKETKLNTLTRKRGNTAFKELLDKKMKALKR